MVTTTSSNGTTIGASGLWTLTSTACTRAGRSATSAIRWARVSISWTGSPRDHRDHLLGDRAVVDGQRQVVARRRRAGVQVQRHVDDELLAERASRGRARRAARWPRRPRSSTRSRPLIGHPPTTRRRPAPRPPCPGTSCTRTHQTPAAAARALVACVASSRSSGGAGAAVRSGQQRAQEPLARGTHDDRAAQGHQLVQAVQHGPVVGGVLGEAQSRVQDDPVDRNPLCHNGFQPCGQLLGHVGDDVVVDGVALHQRAVGPPVHDDVGHAGLRRSAAAGRGRPGRR